MNTIDQGVKRYLWTQDNKDCAGSLFLDMKAGEGDIIYVFLNGKTINNIVFTENKIDPFDMTTPGVSEKEEPSD